VAHQKSKRANQVIERCRLGAGPSTQNIGQKSRGGRHPVSNVDGIIDALKYTKRLVQTDGVYGIDTKVWNPTSEIEHEDKR